VKKSLQLFLIFTCLFSNSFAGDFTLEVESSGPYSVSKKLKPSDITKFGTAFVESEELRHHVVKNFSTCSIETCGDIFFSPLGNIKHDISISLGEERGNAYFVNLITGLIVSNNKPLQDKAYVAGSFMLSFEEKMHVAQTVGELMVANYDRNRAGNPPEKGIVHFEKLIESIQSGEAAGVCRDIATAQAMVLDRLGLDKVYVMAFATIGGGHATVLAQDSEDRSKVVHLNYGEVTTQSNSSGSLSGDTTLPEAGINIRIFDAKGEPVDNLPSELGYIMTRFAGLDSERFSAGVSRDGIHLTSLNYTNGRVQLLLGAALTATGQQTVGVGFNLKIIDHKNIEVTGGVSGQLSEKRINKEDFLLQTQGLYGGIQAKLRSNKINFSKIENAFFELDINVAGNVAHGYVRKEDVRYSDIILDTTNKLTGAFQADINLGQVLWKTRIDVHSSIMKSDVRDEYSHGLTYTGTTISNRFVTKVNNKYGVEFENKIYIRKKGISIENTFYVVSKDGNRAVEIGYALPVSGEVPMWMKGSHRQFSIGANGKFSKGKLNISVKYIRSIDLDENLFNFEIEQKF
jgi:hypothetical protein